MVYKTVRVVSCRVALTLLVASAARAQTVASTGSSEEAHRSVTVDLDSVSLQTALRTIARSAGLRPVYSQAVTASRVRITLHVRATPVIEVFDRALRNTGIRATIVSENVLFEAANQSQPDARARGIITGTVVDAVTKAAIAGASVTVEGSKLTVHTNERGAFQLVDMPAGKYTIAVRRLGYTVTRTSVTAVDNTTIPVELALTKTSTALEEVVTTATGAQRRLELGNDIGRINADSLVKTAPITTLSQLLTARVPGLKVAQSQGTVGGNVKMQIRGLTSLMLSSEPIVIVDGVRMVSRPGFGGGYSELNEPVSPLNDLNPNDIETIEVVKGPSAATLYGTDASNGVIVITTKRGSVGSARWNGYAESSRDQIPTARQPDAWLGWHGTYTDCTLQSVARGACTQDSVTVRKNYLTNNRLSFLNPEQSYTYGANVSGGQTAVRYYFGGNYSNFTGPFGLPSELVALLKTQLGVSNVPDELLHPNTRSALDLRSNTTVTLNSKLEVTLNGGYIHANTRSMSTRFGPYVSALDVVDGNPVRDTTLYAQSITDYFAERATEESDRFIVSANSTSQFTSWLTVQATLGLDAGMRNQRDLWPRDTTRSGNANPTGLIGEGRLRQTTTTANGLATAVVQRGPLRFRTTVGAQYTRQLDDGVSNGGFDLAPGATSILQAATTFPMSVRTEMVTLGGYLEESVAFFDHLFLTGAARTDGASSFGKGYQAAVYPKVSVSWMIDRDRFLARVPGIDELRFRSALGVSGKQPRSDAAAARFSVMPSYVLPPQAGYGPPPVYLTSLGNTDLRPERTREFETGFDAGFLSRRLFVDMTWYWQRTSDMILAYLAPAGLGNGVTNIGRVTGQGSEARITAKLLDTKPMSLDVTLLHARQGTNLVRLGQAAELVQNIGGYREGYPLGSRFVRPIKSFSDANGDGIISEGEVVLSDTARYAGVITPPRSQTMTTTLGLLQQRLRVSALLDRESGATYLGRIGRPGSRALYDPTTPLVVQAAAVAEGTWMAYLNQDGYKYIESGSVTRLREVSVAMAVPASLTRVLRVRSGNVTLSARNLALWSHLNSPDPSSGGLAGLSEDGGVYLPQTRSWSLRFDLGL